MKRYGLLVGLACIFGGIITAFGAGESSELEPEAIKAKIQEHRMGDLVVKAKPGAEVHVEQLRHEFWFGAALSSGAFSGRMNEEDQRKYEETFLANFNAAVTENALKWHDMEREPGGELCDCRRHPGLD